MYIVKIFYHVSHNTVILSNHEPGMLGLWSNYPAYYYIVCHYKNFDYTTTYYKLAVEFNRWKLPNGEMVLGEISKSYVLLL